MNAKTKVWEPHAGQKNQRKLTAGYRDSWILVEYKSLKNLESESSFKNVRTLYRDLEIV